MKKKILSLILAVLMISVLIPMAAFAEGNEAELGGVSYSTLQAAVNAANDGDTVKLLKDVTFNDTFIDVTKGITIDFGAFKLIGVNDNVYPQALLQVNAPGKTVTLKGTTGGIDAKADTYGTRAIAILENCKLVIEGGVYSSMNNCTIYADNAGTELVMNGGAINTNFTSVGNYKQSVLIKGDLTIKDVTIKNEATNAAGNVIDEKADNAKVSITDSKIDAKNITAAVAATSTSTVEIKGTKVSTTSAALANGGDITIGEGTKFESTSGRVVSGATSAKIEGGSFKTSNAFGYSTFPINVEGGSFVVEQLTNNANSTELKISGGEMKIANETNAKQVLNYVAPTEEGGKVQVEINETAYTVNEEGEPEELVAVAKIGDAEFYSLAAAVAEAQNGDTIKMLDNYTINEETVVTGKTITLDLNGKTIESFSSRAFNWLPQMLTLGNGANVTIDDSSEAKNGKITGTIYATSPVQIVGNNATLTLKEGKLAGMGTDMAVIPVEGTGNTVNIEGGTVSGDSPAFNFQGTTGNKVEISGGTIDTPKFTSANTPDGNNTIEVSGGTFTSEIPEGYCASGKAVVYNEAGGYYEIVPAIAQIGTVGYADLAEAMNAAKKGETVELLCDIDLAGKTWTPIAEFKGTLDGQGFTIKNMTVNDTAHSYAGFVCLLSGTIKDVTFDNASVTGQRVGVVAGSNGAWTDPVIENVAVKDSEVFGEQKCGGIMGYVRGLDNVGKCNLTVKDCSVENLVLDASDTIVYQAGGLLGYVDPGINLTVEGCSVKDIVIKNDGYSSEECKDLVNPLYASNEFIGVVNNKISGGVKSYDEFSIVLNDNSVSGELNDIRREACNKDCSLIGGYYNFLDEYGKNPTQIVVDGEELTDELGINQEAALAELEALTYVSDEAKAVIEAAKAAVKEATTVEDVADIVAQAKLEVAAAEKALEAAKADALEALEAVEYTSDEAKAVIEMAKEAVAAATSPTAVAAIVTKAGEDVAAADEALADAQAKAIAELEAVVCTSDEAKEVIAEAKIAVQAAKSPLKVAEIVKNAKAEATKGDEELAAAKAAAIVDFKLYVASLNLNDISFMQAQIDNINEAANMAAVAAALTAANAAADNQKEAELAAMRTDAIDKIMAQLPANASDKAKAIAQEYIDAINNSSDANEIAKLAAEGADKVAYQVECDGEGWLVSGIRALVTYTERGDLAQVKKVMGIVKPILGFFGIH